MTDRVWTARQPDETPVGDLPLRSFTINALRAGGVLTLGELRAEVFAPTAWLHAEVVREPAPG